MLNATQRVMTWAELLASVESESLFVRPNDDDKLFTGRVFGSHELRDLFSELSARGRVLSTNRLVVAPVQEIDAEVRLFVVNGEVLGGSYYRPNDSSYLSQDLIEFAEETARVWSPAPVFTLDVARVGGAYRVVETNCFNGSRFYGSDVSAIVRAVSAYQFSRWRSATEPSPRPG